VESPVHCPVPHLGLVSLATLYPTEAAAGVVSASQSPFVAASRGTHTLTFASRRDLERD